jgi:hypothetical protein
VGSILRQAACAGAPRPPRASSTPSSQLSIETATSGLANFHLNPGRPMKGWLLVGSEAVASDEQLRSWIRRGVAFARSLPAK